MPPDLPERPEMLMPVSDQNAALQFFVEAMKANTATLERVGETMAGMQREQAETLKLVHDTRERVIKMESNRIAREVERLTSEVADLKEDKAGRDVASKLVEKLSAEVEQLREDKLRRDGAVNFAAASLSKGPVIVTILTGLIVVIIILVANGKILL